MAKPTFLITAGPTREYLDPVRFLSNPSSGKMGYALARAAKDRGANVILISGPVSIKPPRGVRVYNVVTAEEMYLEVLKHYRRASVIIMAAAVADYRPAIRFLSKIRKGRAELKLTMVRTKDILATIGQNKGEKILVGFAAETGELIKRAKAKLKQKNLDMIVANDISREGEGFASDYNTAVIIDREGNVDKLPRMTKLKLARLIVKILGDILPN